MKNPDVLIIGAGPVGCVLAERLTNDLNFTCSIIELLCSDFERYG